MLYISVYGIIWIYVHVLFLALWFWDMSGNSRTTNPHTTSKVSAYICSFYGPLQKNNERHRKASILKIFAYLCTRIPRQRFQLTLLSIH